MKADDALQRVVWRRRQEEKRARLTGLFQKRGQTIFVGCLALIEEAFGGLWGKGKPEEDRTPEEEKWGQVFAWLRSQILDLGNTQVRGLAQELTGQWESLISEEK